jgi:hypothetical protein
MAEVLVVFDEQLETNDGFRYAAQACGAPNSDGLWEGWIEFIPLNGGAALRSPRETTQPNRADAQYWATGLSAIYLEGALDRALNPIVHQATSSPESLFDEPAPVFVEPEGSSSVDAVLDPFSVYEKGEVILRQQLSSLSSWHLVNIILAYELSAEPATVLNKMSADALIELIVAHVHENTRLK